MYPLLRRARADLPKPTQAVVAFAPKVGSVEKHRGAVAAKPFCVRNTAVTGRQESLAVALRKLSLCSTNSDPAVQAVGLAVLIRNVGPVAQHIVEEKLEVLFPLPGRPRETRPVRLVRQRDNSTSTANRWVLGDLLRTLRTDWCR